MKKTYILSVVAIAAIAAAACSKVETPSADKLSKIFTFSADFPVLEQESRAAIFTGGKVNWTPGDSISVNAEIGGKGEIFTNSANSINIFSGSLPSEKNNYYALYPYSAIVNWKTSTSNYFPAGVTFMLTNAQTATKGSFDPAAGIMYGQATSEEKSFTFHHVPGYLKFTITSASGSIKSVKVSASVGIAGKLAVQTADDNGYKGSKESGATEYTEVTLSTPDGSAMESGDYYIAVRARKYTGGFTFTFTNTDGKTVSKTLTGDKTVTRGTVYNIGTVAGLEFPSDGKKVGTVENGGIVAFVGTDHYLLLSLGDTLSKWTTNSAYAVSYGATSETDGSANTDSIRTWISRNEASLEEFPALKWVTSQGDGWYLPSISELYSIHSAIKEAGADFNTAIVNAGGKAFDYNPTDSWYLFSSTEASDATKMSGMKIAKNGGAASTSALNKYASGTTVRNSRAVKKIVIK